MDLRKYLETLREEKLLVEINCEVDWKEEIGGVTRAINDTYARDIPALLFNRIKGYPQGYRVLTNGFAGPSCMALSLGLPKKTTPVQLIDHVRKRLQAKIKPKIVNDGPCKENIVKGDKVNLLNFPVPLWSKNDGGRYIGTWDGVFTNDPESDWVNVGLYRIMVHDEKRLGIDTGPRHHISWHYRKYEQADRAMPIAVSIGHEEPVSLVAGTPLPAYEYEIEYAGGLMQQPIELVKCETNDFYVPANSEIVIEGEIPPKKRLEEGPFGEWTGFYSGGSKPRPYIEVKCITFRNNPILRSSLNGPPIMENHTLQALTSAAQSWNTLEKAGVPGIKQVYCGPETGGTVIAVAIDQLYPSHARDVGKVILSTEAGQYYKIVFVTNDDIDITNAAEVLWATHWRSQPDRDWVITSDESSSQLDPSVPLNRRGLTSKVIVDCAWKMTPEFPPRAEWDGKRYPQKAVPSKETKQHVKERWAEYKINYTPQR